MSWLLAVMTTLLCGLASLVARWVVWYRPTAGAAAIFSQLLLFFAATIGLIALVLLPVAYRTRRVPPPRGITVFALVVSLAPILVLILQSLE